MLGLEFEKNTYVFWQPELFCEVIDNSSNKTKQFLLISSEDDTYTWTFCSSREIRRPQDNNKIANLVQTRYGAQMRGFSHSLSPSFVLSNCNCTICRSVATAPFSPSGPPASLGESQQTTISTNDQHTTSSHRRHKSHKIAVEGNNVFHSGATDVGILVPLPNVGGVWRTGTKLKPNQKSCK